MPRTNLRDSVRPEMLAPGTRAKIIARNTFRFTAPDGAIVTRLHQTDIVRALPKGRYQLDSKGWRTPTTKDRMANALPGYRLYARNGAWYVASPGAGVADIPYYDGMILPDAFKAPKKAVNAEKKEQALRLAIRKFCAKLDGLKELPEPSSGDCWVCSMFKREQYPGKIEFNCHPQQSGPDNDSHLREHICEGYMHGSLLLNALTWAGYRNPGLIFQMDSRDMARGKKPAMTKRALKRYLYAKLGLVR